MVHIRRCKNTHFSKCKRKRSKKRKKKGHQIFLANCKASRTFLRRHSHGSFIKKRNKSKRDDFISQNIEYFRSIDNSFATTFQIKNTIFFKEENNVCILYVPEIFSLVDNYDDTCQFLKSLLIALDKPKCTSIDIDYYKCKRIEVGASSCMDIILRDFIKYINKKNKRRHKKNDIKEIRLVNYSTEVEKILYSIGSFNIIKRYNRNIPEFVTLPLISGTYGVSNYMDKRERDNTNVVDYILKCLKRANKELTPMSEKHFSNIIGEIIINAEEHSTTGKRYLIGYYEDKHIEAAHFGIFNLSILNFGKSIYERFLELDEDKEVIKEMKDLSAKYTKKGWFNTPKFREDTLWTLYSLQDGVSRMTEERRGHGSMQFIDSFFKLKGNDDHDDKSKLTLISGNAKIIFDGTYKITTKTDKNTGIPMKIMTFNESNNIEDLPDKNFVSFVNHYFPGTIITAKIYIDYHNTTPYKNE